MGVWHFIVLFFAYIYVISHPSPPPAQNLGGGYIIRASASGWGPTIVDTSDRVKVGTQVTNIAFDEDFIICTQKPSNSISWKMMGLKYDEKTELFDQYPLRKFWIIDKKACSEWDAKSARDKNVHGPYTKSQLLSKREELQISDSLINQLLPQPK
ncbi:MAG: hypothetical protein ACPGU4_14930 [Flavobacteriales bacterium]